MSGAARMDEDRHTFAREVASASCMIEVDVRDKDAREVAWSDAMFVELRAEFVVCDRAAAFDQDRRTGAKDEVRRCGARNLKVVRIERERARRGHGRSVSIQSSAQARAENSEKWRAGVFRALAVRFLHASSGHSLRHAAEGLGNDHCSSPS